MKLEIDGTIITDNLQEFLQFLRKIKKYQW